MRARRSILTVLALATVGFPAAVACAATIPVPAGGDLQAAIERAQPGDAVELAVGAVYRGNFLLRDKGAATAFIVIRTAGAAASLVPTGTRVGPGASGTLAVIQSPNTMPALSTVAAAHHWRLELLEFRANQRGYGEIVALGSGGADQAVLANVPHDLVLDRVLIRGDAVTGQKRGIGLNSASTTISNSYIADCKGVGFDTQAIAGWNGPGPFTITNNYLEGAGENVMLGGASPVIAGLIPSGVTFTRNHVAKPEAWKSPILATPADVVASTGAGGSLAPGTYSYFVVAGLPTAQDSWAWSGASAAVAATVGAGGQVTVSWTGDPKAAVYRVYRGGSPGGADRFFDAAGTSFTDTGAQAPAGFDAGTWVKPTLWSVKNLFELKEAEHVLADGNLFEHVWKESQNGYAILFTPRNQDNTSPWIAVRDVTFSNNIIRGAGAGVQVLGYDDVAPASSQRTQAIRIVNNLFTDLGTSAFPGPGHWLLVNHGPSDVRVEHNTVVQAGNAVYLCGGGPGAEETAAGFVFVNNLVMYGPYGLMGDNHGPGGDTIRSYLPGSTVTANGFGCTATSSGCTAASYPAGNLFMAESDWRAQFVNLGAGDFRVAAGSPFAGAATDGKALGADIGAIAIARGTAVAQAPPAKPTGVRVEVR